MHTRKNVWKSYQHWLTFIIELKYLLKAEDACCCRYATAFTRMMIISRIRNDGGWAPPTFLTSIIMCFNLMHSIITNSNNIIIISVLIILTFDLDFISKTTVESNNCESHIQKNFIHSYDIKFHFLQYWLIDVLSCKVTNLMTTIGIWTAFRT